MGSGYLKATLNLQKCCNQCCRKSSSPIYDAVSSIKEHEQVNRLLATLVACEVITRMLLGRIFQGHTCGGPSYLDMRAPEWHSGENLAGYSLS